MHVYLTKQAGAQLVQKMHGFATVGFSEGFSEAFSEASDRDSDCKMTGVLV